MKQNELELFINVYWRLGNLRSLGFILLLPDLNHIQSLLHISDSSDILYPLFYQEKVIMEIQKNQSPEMDVGWLDNIGKVGFDCVIMKDKFRQ